jgi:hypothetical protein
MSSKISLWMGLIVIGTYNNRGRLRHDRFNDRPGGVADLPQAAKLYQQKGKPQDAKEAIAQITRWRQTQNNSEF